MFKAWKEKYRKEGAAREREWILDYLEETRKLQAYAANAVEFQTGSYVALDSPYIHPAQYDHAASILSAIISSIIVMRDVPDDPSHEFTVKKWWSS